MVDQEPPQVDREPPHHQGHLVLKIPINGAGRSRAIRSLTLESRTFVAVIVSRAV